MIPKQRVILIEDEFLARDELKDILRRQHKDIEVVGEADTTQAGWKLVEQGGIDGVFLDINIQTESRQAGLDLATCINNLHNPPWIVFTTAYPEFALQAHAVHPADYLVKPMDDAKVAKALDWVRRKQAEATGGLPRIIEITHRIKTATGENQMAVEYVDPRTEILFVCTVKGSDMLRVHLLGCRDLLGVAGPLRDWQDRLTPYGFELVRRSHLANLAFRGRLQPDPIREEAYQLAFKGGCQHLVPVSRGYRKEA